jgi:transposase
MTQRDRDRLVALKKAKKGLITQRQAAEEIGQSERHVRRLLKRLKGKGDATLVHALLGRRSNRKLDEKMKGKALEILRGDVYRGFGPTLAAEYLDRKHDIHAGRETVRGWMIEGQLWRAQPAACREDPCLAAAPIARGRNDSMGHQRACLAGRSGREVVLDQHDRRCVQPPACAVRSARFDGRKHASAVELHRAVRPELLSSASDPWFPATSTSKPDISTWQRLGHFYLALTVRTLRVPFRRDSYARL